MGNSCQNCHFLVRARSVGLLPHAAEPLPSEVRRNLIFFFGPDREEKYLGCRKGVWVPSNVEDFDLGAFSLKRITQEREDTCFFVSFQEGMGFEAAEELQKVHYQNRHFDRGYRNTQKSLRVAVWAIGISAFFSFASLIIDIINLLRPPSYP